MRSGAAFSLLWLRGGSRIPSFEKLIFERNDVVSNQPGWAVVLVGERFDIDDLKDRLPPPFDPWVESYSDPAGDGLVLRSSAWANLTEARDVHMDADRILERLHGEALLYDPDATRVTPGGVFEFCSDGRRDATAVVHGAELKITMGRIRAHATATTGGAPPPPAETETQKWFRKAENDAATQGGKHQ